MIKDNRNMNDMEEYYLAQIEVLRKAIKEKDCIIQQLLNDLQSKESLIAAFEHNVEF
ncbi:hypothetical protein L0244_38640 [bacterium]|nr:hypothetical protein [bacterium]